MPTLPVYGTTAPPGQAVPFPDAPLEHDAQDMLHLLCGHLSDSGNWQFVEEVYEFAPDVVERIIGKIKLPFVLALAGTDSLLQKYLAEYSASSFLDENGNTLLHAALLRAVYANMESLFKTDNQYRQRYDFLLEKGCCPDVKNDAGFSCGDLLEILKENVDLFSEVINSEYYHISGVTHCNNQNQMYI